MSDALPFIGVGFRHIVALDAADHLLFLLALSAIYRRQDWRALVGVATAFTVGIEVGQLFVLVVAFVAYAAVDRLLAFAPVDAIRRAPFQSRLVGISVAVCAVSATWAWARWP